jgi:hypothetical protein
MPVKMPPIIGVRIHELEREQIQEREREIKEHE